MIRLKSSNLYYLLGIVPLLALLTVLGTFLIVPLWGRIVALAVGVLLCVWTVRKFAFLPRPKAEYQDLEELDLPVPGGYDVALYTSARMEKYPFLNRTVEILSPLLFKKGSPVKIAVNPSLLSEKNNFAQIAVVRELEKYRARTSVKSVLGLVVPLLVLGCVVEAIFLWRADWLSSSLTGMLFPTVCAAAVVGVLALWNRQVSRQDFVLDQCLLPYFDVDDVIYYVNRSEELLEADDKKPRTEVQRHYARERVKRLELQK